MNDLRASEREALAREMAVSVRKPIPRYNGYCLNCDEVSIGAFCDAGCREDYEMHERSRVRSGLRRIEEEE
jgi:hypothetical protein